MIIIKNIVGVLFIILGILGMVYINIYLLITGIIDIVHGSSILWGIAKIAFREVVGVIVAFICFFVGGYLLSNSK